MYNWNTDTTQLKKDPEKYTIWKLEQMINYGSDGEKIDSKELKRLWSQIQDKLDPYKKRALEYLLWGKLYSLPNNLTFWRLPRASHK